VIAACGLLALVGLQEACWMTQLLGDWERARTYIQLGCGPLATIATARDYRIIRGRGVNEIPLSNVIAVDTETHGPDPYSMQVISTPGVSFMVLADDETGLMALGHRLEQSTCILHFAVHDLDDLAHMGIHPHH
jgi:hypothetical protein